MAEDKQYVELAWRDAQTERLEAELQNRSNEPDMTASDAYHHCADMIQPYLGDQCGPDTLIPSVCELMQFLIGEWRKLSRIDAIIKEWEKGCSNTLPYKEPPEECSECTKGAIYAIKSTIKS